MKILFLCTHNACRSQLAEAVARHIGKGLWQVASAGSEPAGRVHPLTIVHLQRHGYATSGLTSKSRESLQDFNPDLVITVCDQAAGEACPLWLGAAAKVHWGLPDPTRQTVQDADVAVAFDAVIRVLEQRLNALAILDTGQLAGPRLAAALQQIATQQPFNPAQGSI